MAQNIELTDAELQSLKEALVPDPSQKVTAAGLSDFCEVWPNARTALLALQGIIGSIPGVSIFAKAAIGVVIAAGDAAAEVLCN